MERELSSSMSKLTEIPFTEDNADSDNEESIQQREVVSNSGSFTK